ncbi:HlyD family secretion protein [Oxalobacteraceae bacterium A2-2]
MTRRRLILLAGAPVLALAIAAAYAVGTPSTTAAAAAPTGVTPSAPSAAAAVPSATSAAAASPATPSTGPALPASAAPMPSAAQAASPLAAATPDGKAAPLRRPVLLSGEVEALDSQSIIVPRSNSSPLVLRTFVPEGSHVKAGEVVLRIDSGNATNIDRLRIELDQARSRAEREAATLEAALVEGQKALASAEAALAKAKVDAVLPKAQVSALNYDRYQAELDRATRDLAIKQETERNQRQAVRRRNEDGELEVKKLQVNLAFQIAEQALSEVRAGHDGVVVHGFSPWKGERVDEGSSAWPGNEAGVVLGAGKMAVTAWVLEADRPYLSQGQQLTLRFDALPGATLTGTVETITGAPEARARWGQGRYFRVRIALPERHGLPLAAGMSVFAEPQAPGKAALAPLSRGDALTLEGEVASRVKLPVAPPTIPYVWKYKLAQMAPEGAMLEPGQVIARFDASEIASQLSQLDGNLREKQRALDKLRLDQAEAERAGELALAEALSNADKAERKATQPKELIRRVDYDKLVIERTEKQALARLAKDLCMAQARARHAERAGLQSEIAKLQAQVDVLRRGQAALTVKAGRKGMVVYRTNFNGEKFTPGSEVWVGLSVATLADPDQLYVAAMVPEAQSAGIRIGQRARVAVPGASQALNARVSGIGQTFHSKPAAQSIIVRDIELQFDAPPKGLKPGAAVQAELLADAAR